MSMKFPESSQNFHIAMAKQDNFVENLKKFCGFIP